MIDVARASFDEVHGDYFNFLLRRQGGFSENMTAERIEARKQQAAADNAPLCPKCGKPMIRRTQMRGQNQGREFWGCSDYPRCNGTRSM